MGIHSTIGLIPMDSSTSHAMVADGAWKTVFNLGAGSPGIADINVINDANQSCEIRITVDGNGPFPATEYHFASGALNSKHVIVISFLSTLLIEDNLQAGGVPNGHTLVMYGRA